MLLAVSAANAQTTATNWTANDCNGLSHTLFNELDSGKVIVFAWVMPCGTCINPSKTAYNAVQGFATSHPGRVRFYMADDLGDASCSTLSSWVTSNSIGLTTNMKIFDNAGNVIDENDFGGTGMPHIIVMGGTSHTIFFNKKNSASNDGPGITAAINSAITAATASVPNAAQNAGITVSPNPLSDRFTVSADKAIAKITVLSADGKVIAAHNFPGGRMNPSIDMSELASGVYFIRVTDRDDLSIVEKVVKQ